MKELDALLTELEPKRVVVVSGAGMSAESGIPTFRGKEGYWRVGSKEYHPQEMATFSAFTRFPREVWRWYLYRRGVCRAAKPNAAHLALAKLEQALGDRFTLISQNVDGLHLEAGNSRARTLEVHGNIDFMRVHADGVDAEVIAMPADLRLGDRETPISDEMWGRLVDSRGRATRPHILWFDEVYQEGLYRSDSALEAAGECDLIVVVGTSGAAAIPWHACAAALANGAGLVVIDVDESPFTELTLDPKRAGRSLWLRGGAVEWVGRLVERLARPR